MVTVKKMDHEACQHARILVFTVTLQHRDEHSRKPMKFLVFTDTILTRMLFYYA